MLCFINYAVRTRLVGLAALTGAVTSEALYSSTQFASQVSIVVPALMVNILEVDISTLDMEFVLLVHWTS